MSVLLIGANPCLTLRSGDSPGADRVAFASVWRVDWSERGSGTAIVLWHDGRTRVLGDDAELGAWLADAFTRHFDEVKGLPWPEPEVTVVPVALELDLERGLRASAADVTVEIDGPPLDRRPVRIEDFDLGGTPHVLTTVFMPCPAGRLTLGGVAVPGTPTAFLADAEVWARSPLGGVNGGSITPE